MFIIPIVLTERLTKVIIHTRHGARTPKGDIGFKDHFNCSIILGVNGHPLEQD